MTLTIHLSPGAEAKLKDIASQQGIDQAEYARRVLEKDLDPPKPVPDQATLDLLAKWRAESAASTPEERALGEKEWEEFKTAMNEHSSRGHLIYPE